MSRMAAVVVLALLGLAGVHQASAASLPVNTLGVGAGFVTVASCGDLSSATVSFTVTAGLVTGVVVAGLPAGCDGKRISVALLQGTTAVAEAGPVVAAAGSVSFAVLSANPASTSVSSAQLVGVG